LGHSYKIAGIPRAGFEYQDLIGIEVLVGLYRDPGRYAWVTVEASDALFRAIDDVVARRPDGRYELVQVKFTPDPDNPDTALDWAWLTARKGKGSSLLQKWSATTLGHLDSGTLARAVLRTNRKPDIALTAALSGRHIDFDKLPSETRKLVAGEIGDERAARRFFEVFEFQHSEVLPADLEYRLKAQLIPSDTTEAGWLSLRQAVRGWATVKNHPAPDGRIRHADLKQAIARKPAPIPQDFLVPDGYAPPDASFDRAFQVVVRSGDGVRVLWGPPGRGKSTYLSHLVEQKHPANEVWIRHHYFLSLGDQSTNRFFYTDIAHSLGQQIRQRVKGIDENEDLPSAIRSAASSLGAKKGRLVIVMDGLDHVWRGGRSLEQMAQVFDTLLPLPPNVTLIVGTQKVPDEHLPLKLLKHAPKAEWHELPLMSEEAVSKWLRVQKRSGRLLIRRDGQPGTRSMEAIAKAFHDISSGLPLHLVYALETLVRRGGPICVDDVRAVPGCPDGDIRTYYQHLWNRVGPLSRALLHVLAGADFALPPSGLRECFSGEAGFEAAMVEIDHLLDARRTGVLPFHGSIFVFIREMPDHAAVWAARGGTVVAWLKTDAPPYWRWAWLWVTQARLGDTGPLYAGPDRDWVLDAMVEAYPFEQIALILSRAEDVAFAAFDLPRTLELRSLATRIANAIEFQLFDFGPFLETASALAGDPYGRMLIEDDIKAFPPDQMIAALRAIDQSKRPDLVEAILAELQKRMRHGGRLRSYSSDQKDWRSELLRAVAWRSPPEPERAMKYAGQFDDGDMLLQHYAVERLTSGGGADLALLANAAEAPSSRLAREIVAALCFEGLAPDASFMEHLGAAPFAQAFGALHGQKPIVPATIDVEGLVGSPDYDRGRPGLRSALHSLFFHFFAGALSGLDLPTLEFGELAGDWIASAAEEVRDCALALADAVASQSETISARGLYEVIELPKARDQGFATRGHVIATRLAFMDIAIDLQTLAIGLNAEQTISADDMVSITASPWWLAEIWLDAFTQRRLRVHTAEAAKVVVDAINGYLAETITQFEQRAEMAANLARFAYDNGLFDAARGALKRAANCAIGYGYRRDTFVYEILDSLEFLTPAHTQEVLPLLLELAPIYEGIIDFTDGKDTNHAAGAYYEAVVKLAPDRAPALHRHLMAKEHWSEASTVLEIATRGLPHTTARAALIGTFIEPALRDVARDIIATEKLDPALASQLDRAIGPGIGSADPPSKANATVEADRGPAPKVDDFPPEAFEAFLAAAEKARVGYEPGEALVDSWLSYWQEQGRGREVVIALRARIQERGRGLMLGGVLDTAYPIVRAALGRSEAFAWLLTSHKQLYGWHRYMTNRTRNFERLDRVARDYRARWKEFIVETSKTEPWGSGDQETRTIGLERLVYFLMKVGQDQLALDYTRMMISLVKAEVSDQPLPAVAWAL
jgi:hypothetical protein